MVGPSGSASEAEPLSGSEYSTTMAELCASHFVDIERSTVKVSYREFRRMQETNMDTLADFVEEAKTVIPPADGHEDHSKLLAGTSDLIEATENVFAVPADSPGEHFAAETERADSAEQLWYTTDFADLPVDCNWQDEFEVLNARFFAEANESCFSFHEDVSVMFKEEVDTLEQEGQAFGLGFSRSFQARLERMVSDLNAGIPGALVNGPVSHMLAMYSQGASTLGTVRSALKRGDEDAALSELEYYIKVTTRANRIAERFGLAFCVATVTTDLKPGPKPKIV